MISILKKEFNAFPHAFMVAEKVEIITKSYKNEPAAH